MEKVLSVSLSHGEVAMDHDSRKYCPENAHEELMQNNVYIDTCSDIETVFNDIFAKDVEEYNIGKRSDRVISNYYEKIASHQNRDKAPKPVYEYVVQFGNKDNNNVLNPKFKQINEDTRDMLVEFVRKFKKMYLNFRVVSAVIHMDECTPHLHIVFVPIGTGYKNGMKHQCSLTKALDNMGYKNKTEEVDGKKVRVLALTEWQNNVKDVMTDIMEEYGYEREYMNNTDKHMSMTNYKYKCAMEKLSKEISDCEEEVEYLTDKKVDIRKKVQSAREENNELTDINNCLHNENEHLRMENESLRIGNSVLLEQKRKKLEEDSDRELERRKCELEEEYKAKEAAMIEKTADMVSKYQSAVSYCENLANEIKDVKDREEKRDSINRLKERFSNTKHELQTAANHGSTSYYGWAK